MNYDAILISLVVIFISLVPITASVVQFLFDWRMRDEWKWAVPATVLLVLLMIACLGALVCTVLDPRILWGE